MLEILGLTYNDLPPVVPVVGTISADGATIGRGNDNAIILPDPKRLVSRQHLKFSLKDGDVYWVCNISSGNPVFINGEELASGAERPLQDHDRILVGGYVLRVAYAAQVRPVGAQFAPLPPMTGNMGSAGDSDFLAELLGTAATNVTPAAPEPEGGRSNVPDPFQYGASSQPGDIMQMLNACGIEPGSLDNKGDDLINGEAHGAEMDDLLRDPLNASENHRLRHDSHLDPLAMFDEGSNSGVFGDILRAGKGTAANIPPGMDLTHGSELNALFHLPNAGEKPRSGPPVHSVEPRKPDIGRRPAEKAVNMADSGDIDDIIAGLSGGPAPTPKAADADPLATLLPNATPAGRASPPLISAPPIPDAAHSDPLSAFLSDIGPTGHASSPPISAPSAPPIPDAAHSDPLSAFLSDIGPAGHASSPPISAPSAPPEAAHSAPPSAGPGADDLYQAFIEGLGTSLPNREALDKAFMHKLGQVLRNYTQGTIDLVAGRTVVKQAVRANVTVIAPERNNPLKFSPDANIALMSMFGMRPVPGFMEPAEAIRSAFVDLRAHQIGVISGMQAALNHVLDRFSPAMLGDKIPPRGLIENIFLVAHKARLWDEYGHYFHALREKASDHFQEFFGEAFLEAYEKAILTVQSGERAGRP